MSAEATAGMASTRVRIAVLGAALALVAAPALGGCRAGVGGEVAGTTVAAGDSLHGRVTPCGQGQCFSFEGVESSILAFTLASDEGSMAAPIPTVTDPEGTRVAIEPYLNSPQGAATLKVDGVPLRKTGVYRVTVENALPGHEVYYRFAHELRFPPIQDLRARLAAEEATRVYVAAPRGGRVSVRIQPLKGSPTVPEIQGVLDPWGGRALDVAQLPPGSLPPTAGRLADGSLLLQFTAPRPGMYTVLATAQPCREGDATIFTEVCPPGCPPRNVWHTNGPCTAYGLPGEVATTGRVGTEPVVPVSYTR